MADLSKNISNTIRCFGLQPSTKWGQANGFPYTMVFGTAIWGQDAQLATLFTKVCTNTQSFTWDTTSKNYSKVADIGSLVVSHDLTSQTLAQDEWFFVFVSDTKAGEERDFASWTLGTVTDATFTCQAAAGTSWSEA